MHYDTPGSLALSGTKHYDALGEMPSGMSGRDADRLRKSTYYFYTLATMEPVFRKQAGISTAVGVAGVVGALATGGLSLIATGVAGAAGLAMAAGTENCVMETTAWWTKSKRARDAYIQRAMVGDDVKKQLRKAAKRMDEVVAKAKSKQARHAARARAYFLDFIAIGPQKGLKRQLNDAQQAAYGTAYLEALGKKRRLPECMAAGANAAAVVANKQANRARVAGILAVKRERAKAAKAAALAAAKAKAKAEMELKAQQAKLPAGGLSAAPPALRSAVMQAQVQVQSAAAAVQRTEAESVAADREASAAQVQQEQAVAAEAAVPPEQAASVAEQSSEEDAAVEAANPQAAAAETAAVAAGASPDAAAAAGDAVAAGAAPEAAAAAAVAQTAAAGSTDEKKDGFPIVPVLAVAGIAAFLLMRKK